MKLFRVILTIVIYAFATPAYSENFSLKVGSCPSLFRFVTSGKWESAFINDAATEKLRKNPARIAKVAAVLMNEAIPGASISVMSLGSLDGAQGHISKAKFNEITEFFRKQIRKPNPLIASEVNKLVRKRSNADGKNILSYSIDDNFLTEDGSFVFFGKSSTESSKLLIASRYIFFSSCIATLQIGVPEEIGYGALFDAVYSIQLKQ